MNLYTLDFTALESLFVGWGAAPVHARTVWKWLYRQCPADFNGLPDTLPQALQQRLVAETTLALPTVVASQVAADGGTRKDLLQLADGQRVEVVIMRYRHRHSVCISTQVGCACDCRFCATGQMGFVRHLTADEIVAQVVHAQRVLAASGHTLTNFVLMGMGEPLLNYDNTLEALRRLCDPRGMGFVERRITLSTVGIVPGIERLADENLRINLAVSLHAATDAVRDGLLPINRRYPLDVLCAALKTYTARTGRRVMLEWVLIADVNTTREQAEALVTRFADIPVHVNLIRLNPTEYAGQPASPEAVEAFIAILDRAGIPHTMRQHRGAPIAAACGQLRRRSS
ncbi:MAG TPA: 23S rRNA (adenine(2503)-C(2))-methyltransferase RlmN [Anaerolineae bacterium]|nr:23S rRNA (adenine(2503)-C(2))-methyltransferase RlmN [Anaerolineae bacterium]HQK14546.1 23S rRNA (adenine(2503)-C(2))-methyltransferase RlmN [Anaerolineae bacterium]